MQVLAFKKEARTGDFIEGGRSLDRRTVNVRGDTAIGGANGVEVGRRGLKFVGWWSVSMMGAPVHYGTALLHRLCANSGQHNIKIID